VPAWQYTCPSCGASVKSGPIVVEPTDSDPTWPEPIENPAIEGTALASAGRSERFKRLVGALVLTARRAGPTLSVTVQVKAAPGVGATLPLELGLTLVAPRTTFNGAPDVFVKLEEPGESAICSVPARGVQAGDTALFVLTHGDAYEQVELRVR
jgi:hypothetical protein